MKYSHVVGVAVLSLLAACGGDGPTVNTNLSGSMSFTYTGGGGGNFNISGAAPALQANIGASSWAAGFRDDPGNTTGAIGVRSRTAGRYDQFFFSINRVTVGSSTVQVDCNPDLGENCSGFAFLINVSEADQNFDFICFAETGSMAISSISTTRADGTFTGTGSCISANGTVSNFSVTGGTFSVALLSEAQVPK